MKDISKILIIGDSGRGKTTLANNLSKKLGIKAHSTDDILWKIKFSEVNTKEYVSEKAKKIFDLQKWIVEGGGSRIVEYGMEKADLIINLEFSNILSQYKSIIKRNRTRDHETLWQMIKHLKYITFKRFNIGTKKALERKRLLQKYRGKIVDLRTYEEINDYISKIN